MSAFQVSHTDDASQAEATCQTNDTRHHPTNRPMKDHMPDKRYKAPSNKQTHERPHARQTIQGTLQQTDGKGHMPDKRYKSPSNKQTHERTHARQTIQGTVEYLLPRRTPDGSLYSQIFCAPANRNTCSQRYRLEAGLEDVTYDPNMRNYGE
ncbi:hypothetical protein LXL04_039406 [Taraxacum kok-saghyz]